MLPGNCFGWGCGQTLAYWLEVQFILDRVSSFWMQIYTKNIICFNLKKIQFLSPALDVLLGRHLLGLLHLNRPLHHLPHRPPQGSPPGGVDLTKLDLLASSALEGWKRTRTRNNWLFRATFSVCYSQCSEKLNQQRQDLWGCDIWEIMDYDNIFFFI